MKQLGTVTIAIPFYNASRTIADAVKSVFAQTYQDWELILIDDGSRDGSADRVKQIQDSRVRVISDGVNCGLSARLNQIATLANGDYLARMDADDLMHPERIARQVAFLTENPSIDAIDTATYTVDDDLTPLGIRGDESLDCRPESVLRNGLFIHPTMMGRTKWFRQNPYDGAFHRAEDRELWCRTCTESKFARLVEPLFFYREALTGNLQNYINTGKTIRKILLKYGPPLLGAWRTSVLINKFAMRSAIYRGATALGIQGKLIRRRNRPLTQNELKTAQTIITQILETSVPGLTGPSH
ncbi:MAG: glycosyltransferase family 2 protein [Planctomycetes bacterium]|nr:glycosyltransferase family 2 protein [Planctomycetota bacterium]